MMWNPSVVAICARAGTTSPGTCAVASRTASLARIPIPSRVAAQCPATHVSIRPNRVSRRSQRPASPIDVIRAYRLQPKPADTSRQYRRQCDGSDRRLAARPIHEDPARLSEPKPWSGATLADGRGVAEIDELLSADRDLKELARVARHQRRSHRQAQRVGLDV